MIDFGKYGMLMFFGIMPLFGVLFLYMQYKITWESLEQKFDKIPPILNQDLKNIRPGYLVVNFSTSYNGLLDLKFSPTGILITPNCFCLFHKKIFIPWTEINILSINKELSPEKQMLFIQAHKISIEVYTVNNMKIRLDFFDESKKTLQQLSKIPKHKQRLTELKYLV